MIFESQYNFENSSDLYEIWNLSLKDSIELPRIKIREHTGASEV